MRIELQEYHRFILRGYCPVYFLAMGQLSRGGVTSSGPTYFTAGRIVYFEIDMG